MLSRRRRADRRARDSIVRDRAGPSIRKSCKQHMSEGLGQTRLLFSCDEWKRIVRLYGFIVFLHGLGWTLYLHYAHSHPTLVGVGFAAYVFGVRHAFDVDHIAAVDDTVRLMLQKGKKPLGVGFFFALGHSTIVLGLAVVIAIAAPLVKRELPQLHGAGPVIGAGISGAFLWVVGVLNFLILLDLLRVWQKAKIGVHDRAHLEQILGRRGVINRILGGRLKKLMNHSWQMFPLGLLFGLGFDTASEVGLLAMTAGTSVDNIPAPAILSLPILFAAGMSVIDTTDGVFMSKAYSWAFINPLRKVFYNIATTSLSICVALVVGTVELSQMFIRLFNVRDAVWDFSTDLNLANWGYLLVAVFVGAWFLSLALWKIRHVEERDGRQFGPYLHSREIATRDKRRSQT